jgi:tetratricopeptide (TPR) repeat protein
VDLSLTLIEATRFPKIKWKSFAVSQAGLAMLGLEDLYLRARVKEAQCLLWRLKGDMDRAAGTLVSLSQDEPSDSTDRRMHSAVGLVAVQRALNGIQVEDLSTAEVSLVHWTPLGEKASLMEEFVLFRKYMILGRTLRLGGRFNESRAHLEKAHNLSRQVHGLNFDEDLRDLICDLADTLRELDDPVSAEHHLRAEIAQRGAKPLLELSLAEALFAQGRSEEAEDLCMDIQSRPRLLKVEKLRLCITQAKLRHIALDYNRALPHWANAMVAISKFPIETGGTTRTIIASICDILNQQGRKQLMEQSRSQLVAVDKLEKPGRTWCWIAGLRQWQVYLEGQDKFRSHM